MKNKEKKINKLCQRCVNKCKQSADAILLSCPNYEYKPQQLEFKFSFRKKRKK